MNREDSFSARELAEIEFEWIRACAYRFDGEKYREEKWTLEKRREATRLIESDLAFESAADNMALLFGLVRNLDDPIRPHRNQISKERVAARVLFLAVCEKCVPAGYRSEPGISDWENSFQSRLSDGEALVEERLEESRKVSLEQINRLLVNGEERPKVIFDSAYEEVCRQFRTLEWMPYDFERESLQNALVRYYREAGHESIEGQFEAAKERSRAVLFDIAAKISLGEDLDRAEEDPAWAYTKSRVATDPVNSRNDEAIVDLLFERMSESKGWRYVQDLSNELKKAEERIQRVSFNRHTLVLAKHWVDPDCPLWLMTKPAILLASKALSTSSEWSEDRIKKRLGLFGREKGSKLPIREVKIFRSEGDGEWDVKFFEVQKGIFDSFAKDRASELKLVRSKR